MLRSFSGLAELAALGVAALAVLDLGACASNDDIVALGVNDTRPLLSGTSMVIEVGAGTVGGGAPSGGGSSPVPGAVPPNLTPPPIGAGSAPVTAIAFPAFPPGSVSVAGMPRAEPSADAKAWIFREPLQDVFGNPGPNMMTVVVVTDPSKIERLRLLVHPLVLVPSGPTVLVTVFDDLEDQYDLFIEEHE